MEFAGRLASFSPSNLLQWAESERKTGVLVVRRSRREKRQQREAFREKACAAFAAAFRFTDERFPAGATASVSRDAASTVRTRSPAAQQPASEHGGMLVAGL